ncbi:MAG: penicillin-binding protein 1A [Bacterioplanes sp.]|nr:penicillin-binding protein 1A [Bacterioplanes sp.]
MIKSHHVLRFFFWLVMSTIGGAGIVLLGIYLYLAPTLPNTEQLKDIELQVPLRVFSADGLLISEFGEQRRNPIRYEDIPPLFIDALLASEDDAFFEHSGIDLKGLTRAALELIRTGQKRSGGSTITMQVAKNYYLSSEKTFTRKFTEILLALRIEQALSKEEILELYVNKIFLGRRAYGIEAAAQIYYGQSINTLDLAQIAMIAGLPQAPSAANPISNPDRARDRRNYVLARMRTLNKISDEEFQRAARAPITARQHGLASELSAPYIAEMARQEAVQRFGNDAYTAGYTIHTTIDSRRQQAANRALQTGLLSYDRDHGFRGAETALPIRYLQTPDDDTLSEWLNQAQDRYDIDWLTTFQQWDQHLRRQPNLGLIAPAVVMSVDDHGGWVYQSNKPPQRLPMSGLTWAKRYINVNVIGDEIKRPSEVIAAGQPIWLYETTTGLQLAQPPEVEGSLVSLRPDDGAIQALVGGFSFSNNQFNRAIQAERQPGSAFKPFVYAAALERGFTAATIINDAPVVFDDANLENTWRPQNNSGTFYGPTRLREALYRSQNLVSIRILNQIGAGYATRYIANFGIPREKMNRDLSLALGASALTPMELATGFAILANGGYAIEPYLIDRIENDRGDVLYQHHPATVCYLCEKHASKTDVESEAASALGLTEAPSSRPIAPRVMDERVNFILFSMLQDVVKRGTGRRALVLNRNDLAGKTGTTNDQKDGWFGGYSRDLATTVWVGFDQPVTLGRWAYGSNTALPIWVDYNQTALNGVPERPIEQPEGVVSVRIDPDTGLQARPGQTNAIFEYFREENIPEMPLSAPNGYDHDGGDFIPEQLF